MANQFRLLRQRRFAPFFATQALGAFNDNLFKNALVILATYQTARFTTLDPALLTNLAGGLFVLPYLLFSGWAGQVAEKLDKALLIRWTKLVELLIMVLAGIGFAQGSLGLLLGALFLMGCQSTLFAPAKYGLLPQVLRESELVGGNALVEMGTFVAILLGTLLAGELAQRAGTAPIITALLLLAVAGLAWSLWIPRLPAAAPTLRIDWNPWRSSWANIAVARRQRPVWLSILGISWFWFYGALVLAQLPLYARQVLGADEQVLSLLLITFSVGVGLGSLLCERLSGRGVEIGLVPFGSIGLTLFAIDLYFATPVMRAAIELTPATFLAMPESARLLADLALIGVFGGFFIVPLYAYVQRESRADEVSRIIAANSILNALFMVAAALIGAVGLQSGMTVPQVILMTAAMNAVIAVYIYSLVPEFLLRFLAWIIVHLLYRIRVTGIDRIPAEGPALLVCNHVSFVDAIIIAGMCPRPVRFIMDSGIFRIPILSAVFRGMKAVPIASQRSDPETFARAFETVSRELQAGHLVCIFPEGKLTSDGEIDQFRPGMMRVLARDPVPVVPMALSNLWRSMFSRRHKQLWQKWPRRALARISLNVGEPLAADVVSPELAREHVQRLRERP